MADLERFFRDYADLYNRALAGQAVFDDIMARFSESFVAASPHGVNAGENGPEFRQVLKEGYDFYRRIGARRMRVHRVDITLIDETHHMAKVCYAADYVRPSNGEALTLPFEVTYLLETRDGRSRIFAFVASDEMAVYREHGLLEPAAQQA